MIRKATIYDIFAIADMWQLMQKEMDLPFKHYDDIEKEKFLVSLIPKIYSPDRVILVAEMYDKVVGFVMGYAHYPAYGTSSLTGTCEHFYIYPEYRNKGIANKLLDILQMHGKNMGCNEIELITKYDPKLIEVYKRKGYTPSEIVFIKEV